MSPDRTTEGARSRGRMPRLSPGIRVLCTALVVVPVFLALCVPLYQRMAPALGGIPFFFWFQMLTAVLAALGTGTVYFIAFRHEHDGGDTE